LIATTHAPPTLDLDYASQENTMTRQLLIALGTLAAGAMFGLVSPAQAHSSHDHRDGYHRHERHQPVPPHARPYVRPVHRHAHGHYVSRPGHRYVPERWFRDSHGHLVKRPGYWVR
jgi:hypothetical protein